MSVRYAVYFVPEDESDLARFGNSVLQRDADARQYPSPQCDFPTRQSLIASAAIYGFHATLKAPFRLREGASLGQVRKACSEISKTHECIELEGLDVVSYKGFSALAFPDTLHGDSTSSSNAQQSAHSAVRALSNDCVLQLEHCRAPLTQAEEQKRQPSLLNESQRENLKRFGYPHVRDQFNFHMTVSSKLSAADQGFLEWARQLYHKTVFSNPMLDRLALCEQREIGGPFRRIQQWSLLA